MDVPAGENSSNIGGREISEVICHDNCHWGDRNAGSRYWQIHGKRSVSGVQDSVIGVGSRMSGAVGSLGAVRVAQGLAGSVCCGPETAIRTARR
jgi:hypothetical protein